MNFLTSPIRAVTSVARYALGGSGLPKKLTTFKEYNAFTRYLTDPRTQYQVLIPDDVLLRFSAIPHFKAFFTYTCEALMIEKLATCEIIPEASHADYEKSINKKHRFFGSEEEFQLAGEALAHLPAMKDRSFNVKDVLNAHSNATTTVTRLYLEGRQPTDMEADVICKFIEYQVCQHFRELQLANLVIDWLNQPKDADINEQTERSKTFFLLRNVLAGSERSDVTFPSCLRIESSKKLYKLDFECQATTKAYLATPDATQLEIVKRCREVASVVQCIHSWRNVLKDPKLPEQMVNSALVRFKDLPYAAELRRCMITMFRMHAAIQLGVEVEPEMKRNNREAQDALHKVAPHLGENRELSKEEMTIDLKNARIDAFASIVDRMYSDDVIFDVVSHYLNLMFTHVRNDDVYSEEEEEEEEDGGDDQYDTGVEEEAGSESESESEEETAGDDAKTHDKVYPDLSTALPSAPPRSPPDSPREPPSPRRSSSTRESSSRERSVPSNQVIYPWIHPNVYSLCHPTTPRQFKDGYKPSQTNYLSESRKKALMELFGLDEKDLDYNESYILDQIDSLPRKSTKKK